VTSASLLLPVNVWGANYVVADAFEATAGITGSQPTTVIIGQQDGTNVTVDPVAPIVGGGGLPGTGARQTRTYKVQRGQYLQFSQLGELTGSAVQADQPVAVIGGSTEMRIPQTLFRADSGHQMLPPIRALGSEYVAVRYRNRRNRGEETVPWRIVGVVDGTVLTFDPPQAAAPGGVGARQVLRFDATGPFVVRSQDAAHPFYVSQHMTGGMISTDGVEQQIDGEGDPEFVNMVPPDQFLPRYTFFTDPTYPETNLVVVRRRDGATGLMPDVTLDCAGTLAGWQPIDGQGLYEYTRADLQTGDFEAQGGCDNGVHVISGSVAAAPDGGLAPPAVFGVTVWGWGNTITYPPFGGGTPAESNPRQTRWVSYAYPAGANVAKLNDVVLPTH
jgi:hypothetical protein